MFLIFSQVKVNYFLNILREIIISIHMVFLKYKSSSELFPLSFFKPLEKGKWQSRWTNYSIETKSWTVLEGSRHPSWSKIVSHLFFYESLLFYNYILQSTRTILRSTGNKQSICAPTWSFRKTCLILIKVRCVKGSIALFVHRSRSLISSQDTTIYSSHSPSLWVEWQTGFFNSGRTVSLKDKPWIQIKCPILKKLTHPTPYRI